VLQVWKTFSLLTKVGMPERSYRASDYWEDKKRKTYNDTSILSMKVSKLQMVINQSQVNRGVDKKSVCSHNLIEYNIPYTQLQFIRR